VERHQRKEGSRMEIEGLKDAGESWALRIAGM
jgi:hypothetical protein